MKIEILLKRIKRTDEQMLGNMRVHYSAPKGFVGRSICYSIYCENICYGTIAGGSATRYLPGRDKFFSWGKTKRLNNIVNNIFFHVEKKNGSYPCRWFTKEVIDTYTNRIEKDWKEKYGDVVEGHETLVELPRTGECYKKAKWIEVGVTKGYTCKRIAGESTDSWTGKRVWNTKELRPKRVLVAKPCGEFSLDKQRASEDAWR